MDANEGDDEHSASQLTGVLSAVTTTKEVNKEAIRILVADVGYNEASRQLNIPAPTLRQWAHRGQWSTPMRTDERVTLVTRSPADAHSVVMSERKAQSRTLLSEYQVKALHEATAHEKPLSITRQVNDLASIHAKVWPEDQTQSATFSLNVLNLNMLSSEDGPTLDE